MVWPYVTENVNWEGNERLEGKKQKQKQNSRGLAERWVLMPDCVYFVDFGLTE